MLCTSVLCSSEQFLHRGSNEIFVASIVKIKTIDKDVLDSEWASCAVPVLSSMSSTFGHILVLPMYHTASLSFPGDSDTHFTIHTVICIAVRSVYK